MEAFKHFIDSISSPATIFTLATVLFVLYVSFPRISTSKPVSLILLALFLGFFGIGLTDKHFRGIVTTPDNVPIVGLIEIGRASCRERV